MKIAIYIRVSTEDQAKEGYSLEVQREYLKSFAKLENLEIFKVYQDDGISGYSTERPALKELLKDAKERRFDLVLVYKIDRFSRNLKDLLNLVDELSSYDVGFRSATEPFDTTTSAGKLMFQQLGSFAEFERNRIKERVFPGMVKGVQQSNWQGARYAPYGYKYSKEKKLLEVDEQESKVVKLIYTMFLCDKSINSITGYLTRKGYRNRKGNIFSTKLIGDILKNRIYIGQLLWNRKSDNIIIAKGKHEAIIAEEDFELVQEKLKERRVERKMRVNDYPLSGLLYCAKCNHTYVGASAISNHRTKQKSRWYRCSGPYRSFISCKNKNVKALDIESEVAQILETLLKSDKLKSSRWTRMTAANFPVFDKISKTDMEKRRNRLKMNQKKQSKLTDAYLENLLSEELYKQKNEGLRQEEEELRKLIALQEVRAIERERSRDYLDRVEEFVEGYDPNRKEVDALLKKQILHLLFKNIKIAQKKRLFSPKRIFSPSGYFASGRFAFSFFAPFNFFFSEKEQNLQCPKNKRLMTNRPERYSFALSDDPWFVFYKLAKTFFFTAFQVELAAM